MKMIIVSLIAFCTLTGCRTAIEPYADEMFPIKAGSLIISPDTSNTNIVNHDGVYMTKEWLETWLKAKYTK